MISKFLKFTLIISFLLGLAYLIQINIIQSTLTDKEANLIQFSYLFNFAFTYILMLNILVFKKILEDKLGFVYLGISTLKFVLFYFLVKSKNIEINKSDFLLFFIPFVLCLGIEIFYVSRILNSVNYNENS